MSRSRKPHCNLTVDRLREVLEYNRHTGEFFNKISRGSRCIAGRPAGHFRKDGYRVIFIDGISYLSHRLAWLFVYGDWPQNDIDHIDGDPSNNSILNLRDVTHRANRRNSRLPSDNTSGACGVIFCKRSKRWIARIQDGGLTRHIGAFEEKERAIAARKESERLLGYHEFHGLKAKRIDL